LNGVARTTGEPTIELTFDASVTRATPLDQLPEFLSPEEFRRYVGIGRSTIYDLLRRDELKHVRFGRCIRIPKSVLASPNEGVE
jgi:excisionase family DNA binding protein